VVVEMESFNPVKPILQMEQQIQVAGGGGAWLSGLGGGSGGSGIVIIRYKYQ
jgi:hypothetical protein